MVRAEGNCIMPSPYVEAYAINWSLIDRVILYVNYREVQKVNLYSEPSTRVQWLEKIVDEAGVDMPLPLKSARDKVDKNIINDKETFEALITSSKEEITKKSMEKNAHTLQHGARFKESRRGPSKITTMLDNGLQSIIEELGSDSSFNAVIDEIEKLAGEGWSSVWQGVDHYSELVFIQDPDSSREAKFTFKTIKNRLSDLKKSI